MPGPPASTPTRDLGTGAQGRGNAETAQRRAPRRPRAAEGSSTECCHVMGQKDNPEVQHRIAEELIWAEIADLEEDPCQRLSHAKQFYLKSQCAAIVDRKTENLLEAGIPCCSAQLGLRTNGETG